MILDPISQQQHLHHHLVILNPLNKMKQILRLVGLLQAPQKS